MRVGARLAVTAATVFVAAVLAALAVTIADLYLTGHGYASITREFISRPAWGVHMSIGDLVMLGAALAAGALTWILLGPAKPDDAPTNR
jgi:hypothetical protein